MNGKMRQFWNIIEINGEQVMFPKENITCPICSHDLLIHNFIATFTTQHSFYHCDVHCKCSFCGYYAVFGIPITKEECEELKKSKLHGKVFKEDLMKIYHNKIEYNKSYELIKKKLEYYGYW